MRQGNLVISSIRNPAALCSLAVEATAEGHRMVGRLIEEWSNGTNCFDKPGERSYVATVSGEIAGVCGLNVDPFSTDSRTGRVRRLYVSVALRRRGIGGAIVRQVIRDASGWFNTLQLRPDNSVASEFYQALGFVPINDIEHCTHRLSLSRDHQLQLTGNGEH